MKYLATSLLLAILLLAACSPAALNREPAVRLGIGTFNHDDAPPPGTNINLILGYVGTLRDAEQVSYSLSGPSGWNGDKVYTWRGYITNYKTGWYNEGAVAPEIAFVPGTYSVTAKLPGGITLSDTLTVGENDVQVLPLPQIERVDFDQDQVYIRLAGNPVPPEGLGSIFVRESGTRNVFGLRTFRGDEVTVEKLPDSEPIKLGATYTITVHIGEQPYFDDGVGTAPRFRRYEDAAQTREDHTAE